MSIWTDTARPSRTGTMDKQQFITSLEHAWKTGSRWQAVTRPYTAGDVYRLRGSIDMYPDQSLYPSDSVPALLRRLNNALKRADEIAHMKGDESTHWFAPLVADAEAGFGGPLPARHIMQNMFD